MNPKYGLESNQAPRFTGIRTFMKLQHVKQLLEVDAAIIGIPFDTGVSFRAGARFGPSSIREISVFLRPANHYHHINPFEHLSVVDYGDLPILPGYMEDSYEIIKHEISKIAHAGVIPVALGGDHSITLAELRGLADVHGQLSLIHFDAHGDTWDNYWGKKYTHGTPFRRALEEDIIKAENSIQIGLRGTLYDPNDHEVAKRFGFDIITADELRTMNPNEVFQRVQKKIGNNPTFLSFDIDFFDPSYAPGTGTPEIAGLTSAEGQSYLRALTGFNYVGFDLVEVLPAHDVSQITALLGANMVYEFLSLIAVAKEKK